MYFQPVLLSPVTSPWASATGSTATAAIGQDNTASRRTFSSGYRFVEMTGEELFANVCQGCHMPDARGASGAGTYPSLADNKNLESGSYSVHLVVNGRHGMPAFRGVIPDEQIWEIAAYIRSLAGNVPKDVPASRGDDISTGEAKTQRHQCQRARFRNACHRERRRAVRLEHHVARCATGAFPGRCAIHGSKVGDARPRAEVVAAHDRGGAVARGVEPLDRLVVLVEHAGVLVGEEAAAGADVTG